MADKKISQLTAATTPLAGTEVLPIVQGGSTVKVSAADITAGRAVGAASLTVDGAAVINESGADADFRVEGDTDANLIFGDASTDRIGIGTNSPLQKLHVVGSAVIRSTTANSQLLIQSSPTFQNSIAFSEVGVRDNGALGFESGADTLLYRGGTTSVASGGTLVFSATSNGRFGIGTSTPGDTLDVRGNGSFLKSGADTYLSVVAQNDTYAPIINFGVSGVRNSGIIGFPPGDDAFVYRSGASSYSTGTERLRITVNGNTILGNQAALATTATNGFVYVPTCAGAPTGTPTAITGMAPIVVDTTNNKLYFYSSGVWRDAGP